jgi:uncharacterized membrane protein
VLSFFILRNVPPPQIFFALDVWHQIIISTVFALPLALDWITQTYNLRESNNTTRFFTGVSVGLGTSLLSFSAASVEIKTALYLGVAISILIGGLMARHSNHGRRGKTF